MGISMIWAMDRNYLIGNHNALPWRLPNDMKHFIAETKGKTVVMGRKTFDSIGKPLPKRRNIVLTRNQGWTFEGVEVVHDLSSIIKLAQQEEIMIIGGAELYRQALPSADKLIVTFIDHAFEGTDYFPPVDWKQWSVVEERAGLQDEDNPYPHRFVIYERC